MGVHRIGRHAAALALLLGTVAVPGSPAGSQGDIPMHPTAELVELELLPADGIRNEAAALNEAGTIVGQADGESNFEAAWWAPGGGGERLGVPIADIPDECCSEEDASVTGINSVGQIVGNSLTQEVLPQWGYAWRRDTDGTIVPLSAPHGFVEDINDHGVAAGVEWSPEGWRAATWLADGTRDFIGAPGTHAVAINSSGQLAGRLLDDPMHINSNEFTPVRWDADGTMHVLAARGAATDINEAGAVSGYVGVPWARHLAHWSPEGTQSVSDIEGVALGIDADGLIVGRTDHDAIQVGWTPIVWDPETDTTYALPTGAATGGAATAINDRGQVVGFVAVAIPTNGAYASRAVTWHLAGLPDPPRQTGPTSSTTTTAPVTSTTTAPPAAPLAVTPRFTG